MKKLLLALALSAVILMSGCGEKDSAIDSAETEPTDAQVITTDALDNTSPESEAPEPTTEADTTAESSSSDGLVSIFEPTGYNYYYVDKYCDAIQSMTNTAKAQVDFFETYSSILNMSDSDDVSEQFGSLVESTSDDSFMQTLEDFPSLLEQVYDNLENNNGDPNLLPLIKECSECATDYLSFVYYPQGAYSKFFDEADEKFIDVVTRHDDIVAYLYSINFYTDEQ